MKDCRIWDAGSLRCIKTDLWKERKEVIPLLIHPESYMVNYEVLMNNDIEIFLFH